MTLVAFTPGQDTADGGAHALPANLDAEQALLGCILFDNAATERTGELHADHFHEPFHQRLYAEIARRVGAGQLAEPIVLVDRFKADPAFVELGGLAYLADLVDRAPPSANASDYASEIVGLALRRDLIRFGNETAKLAQDPEDATGAQLIEQAESTLYGLAERRRDDGHVYTFAQALTGAVRVAAAALERDGLAGVSTGLTDLDKRLGGLHPSDLLILAGRPSMGKSALATNIAYHVARTYRYAPQADGSRKTTCGGQVLFYSLEMSAEQLAMRILAQVSGVPSDRIRKGEIDAAEYGRIRDAAIEIQEAPLTIDDTGALSIAKLAARARRMKRRQGLDLIVVDYLQLATPSNPRRNGNRVEDVSEITAALKALAKELDVPVLALSQLSRKVEDREDKRPQLSDLRESGSIEQDSDVVMFVYREAYYLGRQEPKAGTDAHLQWQDKMAAAHHQADAIIGKARHGPIGTVKLSFNEDLTTFGNLAQPRHEGAVRTPYRDA